MYITLKNIANNKSYSFCTNLKKEHIDYISKEQGIEIEFKKSSRRKNVNMKGKKKFVQKGKKKFNKKDKGKEKKRRKNKRRSKMNN